MQLQQDFLNFSRMKLTVINSGSAGNGYILEGRDSALMIECGVPPKDLFRLTACPVSKIAGCLVSHEHVDHARHADRYLQLGIPIFASRGTLTALRIQKEKRGKFLPTTGLRMLAPMKTNVVGNFYVTPFDVVHDASEPLGFIIEHRECGRVLFMTDTSYCKYNFRDFELDHVLVEANYDDEILDGNVAAGLVDQTRAKRTRNTHMSIRQTCSFLRSMMTASLKTVILIHLSKDNAYPEKFARMAEETALFAHIGIAAKGFSVELNKNENFAVL